MMRKFTLLLLALVLAIPAWGGPVERIQAKAAQVKRQLPQWLQSGGSPEQIKSMGEQVKALASQGQLAEAEALLDRMLSKMEHTPSAESRWPELVVQGDSPPLGIYDPSLEYDSQGVGWLAYSAVKTGSQTGDTMVETHLAKSMDRGKTWRYVRDLNNAQPATLNGERGMWWNEVSTLVHDPDDKGREWKLYYHKYFAKMPYRGSEQRRLQYGWIAVKTASDPSGPWSDEKALFGVGRSPSKPYSAAINVSQLHPQLKDYVVLTEPGSLYHQGRLYLSLQAVKVKRGKPVFDLILLASDDHGDSWRYVATPLRADQAKAFAGEGWTGSSLVEEEGRQFLMVCPETSGKPGERHKGTVVFEFSDISSGRLIGNQRPKAVLQLKHDLTQGGQSDYDEGNVNGGIIMPQNDRRNLPRFFRIFRTGRGIVG